MGRLTTMTPKGPALKLDNPTTEQEAREQLMEKYTIAIRKLARYEDLEEQGRLVEMPCAANDMMHLILRPQKAEKYRLSDPYRLRSLKGEAK